MALWAVLEVVMDAFLSASALDEVQVALVVTHAVFAPKVDGWPELVLVAAKEYWFYVKESESFTSAKIQIYIKPLLFADHIEVIIKILLLEYFEGRCFYTCVVFA